MRKEKGRGGVGPSVENRGGDSEKQDETQAISAAIRADNGEPKTLKEIKGVPETEEGQGFVLEKFRQHVDLGRREF